MATKSLGQLREKFLFPWKQHEKMVDADSLVDMEATRRYIDDLKKQLADKDQLEMQLAEKERQLEALTNLAAAENDSTKTGDSRTRVTPTQRQRKARMSRMPKHETLTQMMGLVLLSFMLLTLFSPSSEVTFENGWNASSSSTNRAIGLVAEKHGQTSKCLRTTGGTCFILGCAAFRGNTTCATTIGVKTPLGFGFGWHSCECQDPLPCAHSDGTCHSRPQEDWHQWFRGESDSTALFAVAPVLRSGVSLVAKRGLALNHLWGKPGKIQWEHIEYDDFRTWVDVRDASGFKYKEQALVISAAKGLFFHAMQPCLFILPYLGYSSTMDWGQFTCATIVVINELWYAYLICFGLCFSAGWLLYGPMSDHGGGRLKGFSAAIGRRRYLYYFAAPTVFLASWFAERELFSETLCKFTWILSMCASLSGIFAMTIGLVGAGSAFPALMLGYAFCACEMSTFFYERFPQ